MKIKYRFWGCLDMETQALTREGWKYPTEITDTDEILQIDPVTNEVSWSPAKVSIYDYQGEMVEWGFGAVSTPNHRWLADIHHRRGGTTGYDRKTLHTEFIHDVPRDSRLVLGGGAPTHFSSVPKYTDELVETVAWYICDGSDHINQSGYHSIHMSASKQHKVDAWRRLSHWWTSQGATFTESDRPKTGNYADQRQFYLGRGVVAALAEVAPRKQVNLEFLSQLTHAQAVLFYTTLIAADGHVRPNKDNTRWMQVDQQRVDMFQMLTAMLGKRTGHGGKDVTVYASDYASARSVRESERRFEFDGQVWCPTVDTGYFMARRNGITFWTGNTSPQGTRSVYTYVEILTDSTITEYVNDEMVDQRPNPIGKIPIVHIRNLPVPSSPWGLSDCQDIIQLNLQYNAINKDISDIVNYHAAPITIITGAKASNLEKGAKRVWGGLPKEAQVFNLEGGGSGLQGALEYLEKIKRSMHEIVGIPETALGQVQPISNTSGVALSIQFQPLMNRYCNPVEAPVWMADGSFMPIGEVHVGDSVMGWVNGIHPDSSGTTPSKILSSATVEKVHRQVSKVVKVTLESGRVIRCTPDHVWLSGSGGKATDEDGPWTRVAGNRNPDSITSPLVRGEKYVDTSGVIRTTRLGTLVHVIDETTELTHDQQRNADWLGGMFDGEGSCHTKKNARTGGTVSVAQSQEKNPEVYRRIGEVLDDLGFSYRATDNGYFLRGGRQMMVDLLNMCRFEKRQRVLNRIMGSLHGSNDRVVRIEPAGEEEVVCLSTSTGNYVVWGYASKNSQKVAQYSEGLQQINELILLTLAVKEPDTLVWKPNPDVPLKEGQVDVLDPADPDSFITSVHFPQPLPLDKLVLLNEIQMELQLNLQSREGALRKLGEEYPEHKLAEIQQELLQDALDKGTRTLMETEIQKEIMDLTGMQPGIDGGPAIPLDPMMAEMPDGSVLGDAAPNIPAEGGMTPGKMGLISGEEGIRQRLLEQAFGTKQASSTPSAEDTTG